MNKYNSSKRKWVSRISSTNLMDNKPETPPWSELPPTVVVQIYQYLDHFDMMSMAESCKPWNRCYHHPSLWRRVLFNFVDKKKNTHMETDNGMSNSSSIVVTGGKHAKQFATHYARYLKDVRIHMYNYTRKVASELLAFSKLLDETKLKSLKVFFFNSLPRRKTPKEDLLKALDRIILNQPSLEEFSIVYPELDTDNGLNVLKSLARKSGDTLKALHIDGLFKEIDPLSYKDNVITEIKKFTHLCSIEIENVFLNDVLFTFWTEQCPSLSFIRIWFTPQGYAPSNEVWKALVKTHPYLKVEIFAIEKTDVELDIAILSPAIPLVKLEWCTDACYSDNNKLRSFLNRLTSYKNSLQGLNMTFIDNLGDPDQAAVIDALSKFSKLAPWTFKRLGRNSNIWFIFEKDNTDLEYSSSSSSVP